MLFRQGVLEAGFFPSCVYLLSTYYTRYEVGKRYAFFYILGCVASAFAGILAFGLMQLKGTHGLNGWYVSCQDRLCIPQISICLRHGQSIVEEHH